MRTYPVWLSALLLAAACGGTPTSTSDDGGAPDAAADDGAACTSAVTSQPGLVVTDRGPVQGAQANGAWAFLGIPYAAPPIGTLRWAPPQQAACWSHPLAATSFGSMCTQLDSNQAVVGAEDCLHVNVWTPTSATSSSALPVLLFVHGGGNVQGSAGEKQLGTAIYDGAGLAAAANVVVVTLDYRLGPFGYLAHPSFGGNPGNYGLLDQIAAAQWTQRNVAAFGGDPKRVLLFGQSAGAVDVCALVASPLAKGLFSAALMESGACVAEPASTAQSFAQSFAQTVHCDTASDPAACMRALDATTIETAIPATADVIDPHQAPYQLDVDGASLLAVPSDALAAGTHNHVPLVIGSNSGETAKAVAQQFPNGLSEPQYELAVQTYVAGSGIDANQVLQVYPASDYATPTDAYVALTSDAKFTCNARYAARQAAKGQTDQPIRRYWFTRSVGALAPWHGLELFFVFRHLDLAGYTPNAGDLALAGAIDGYWTALAGSGDPSVGATVAWPTYDATTDAFLDLDDPVAPGAGVRTAQCDFWDAKLGR